MSLFAPKIPKAVTPQVQAQSPVPPAERSSSEVAALTAEQRSRFTRRRGRAYADLSGGGATGGMSAGRTLGAMART